MPTLGILYQCWLIGDNQTQLIKIIGLDCIKRATYAHCIVMLQSNSWTVAEIRILNSRVLSAVTQRRRPSSCKKDNAFEHIGFIVSIASEIKV